MAGDVSSTKPTDHRSSTSSLHRSLRSRRNRPPITISERFLGLAASF